MQGHGGRHAYYIIGEGFFQEPAFLSGGHGCPVAGHAGASSFPAFKFGRMFPMPPKRMTSKEWVELSEGLIHLGLCMNNPLTYCKQEPGPPLPDSNIPAGYTYLGQFITHEITFDNTQDLPAVEPNPQNMRSPSLDLDSLYGLGPGDEQSRPLYEDGPNPARLKLGRTLPFGSKRYLNDLPRDIDNKFKALIGDPRNDENLAVAQTHVAFIKFHNKVVDELKGKGHGTADLFDCARIQVIRHFQWLVLHDYLPRLVDEDIIDCVREHGCRWFRVEGPDDLYMPLEFSAAAFRIGHTMIRSEYDWNWFHAKDGIGVASSGEILGRLFEKTALSGGGNFRGLPGDWLIDWRRFYEFPETSHHHIAKSRINMARGLDTNFDMHLDQMTGFDHKNLPEEKRSITVRNLLRGLALGLPTGEEVAAIVGEEPLCPQEIASGPYAQVLSAPVFKGKTPLWYYILKEAELKKGGNKLGRVGGRIVAETLIGLIKNSRYSILKSPGWYPSYTERGVRGTKSAVFEMVDLLENLGTDDINPYKGP